APRSGLVQQLYQRKLSFYYDKEASCYLLPILLTKAVTLCYHYLIINNFILALCNNQESFLIS
ncbi:hypothetical protein, partial [Rheinheimera salexigens]|uniref:hypothetical protein n=1 Tax=Rheinheimera salexigens TaxID=1628148 RepID=UPI001F2F4C69